MGQKIHGALLTASTQFMRKRTMDVYLENYMKTNSTDDAEVHRCKRPTEGLKRLHELSHGRRWSWGSSLGLLRASSGGCRRRRLNNLFS
jgi:hypothetical protein